MWSRAGSFSLWRVRPTTSTCPLHRRSRPSPSDGAWTGTGVTFRLSVPLRAGSGCPAPGRPRRVEGQLYSADARSDEGQQPNTDVLSRSHLGQPADEALVKGAHHRSVGVVRVDPEGAVAYIDGHGVFPSDRWSRSEGEAVEGLDDLPHRLLKGRMAERTSELPAPPGPLLLGGTGGPFTVSAPEERDEAPDEEADLGVAGEERLPEPVALGGPAPALRNTGLLLEHPRLEQPIEVSAHRRRMDSEEAGELGNLAGPLPERLHDGQAPGVSQEPVALGPDGLGKTPVHVQTTTMSTTAATKSAPR